MLTDKQIMKDIKLYKERLAIKVYNYKQFTEVIKMFREVLVENQSIIMKILVWKEYVCMNI